MDDHRVRYLIDILDYSVYLRVEEQVFSDVEVVEEYVVLWTKTQAAADQSHILTYVITVNVRTAAAGWEKAWE